MSHKHTSSSYLLCSCCSALPEKFRNFLPLTIRAAHTSTVSPSVRPGSCRQSRGFFFFYGGRKNPSGLIPQEPTLRDAYKIPSSVTFWTHGARASFLPSLPRHSSMSRGTVLSSVTKAAGLTRTHGRSDSAVRGKTCPRPSAVPGLVAEG